ncbi:MAG: phosphatase, partial [bacterium]
MLKINTDLHTHTVASGHAYCTVDEMAKGAFR